MSTTTTTPSTVEFQPNVTEVIRLRFPEGKPVQSRFGGDRVMFTLSDGRRMFLDADVAIKIDQLGVEVDEPFTITKQFMGRRANRDRWNWAVERLAADPAPAATEDTELERQLRASIAAEQQKKAAGATAAVPDWANRLLAQTNVLTDVYAAAVRYGLDRHQGRVKPEEIRALMT